MRGIGISERGGPSTFSPRGSGVFSRGGSVFSGTENGCSCLIGRGTAEGGLISCSYGGSGVISLGGSGGVASRGGDGGVASRGGDGGVASRGGVSCVASRGGAGFFSLIGG